MVADFQGTVAAEHGIGQLKIKWLPWARSEAEIALMREIKKNLDPKGIMNPGKVLPDERRVVCMQHPFRKGCCTK